MEPCLLDELDLVQHFFHLHMGARVGQANISTYSGIAGLQHNTWNRFFLLATKPAEANAPPVLPIALLPSGVTASRNPETQNSAYLDSGPSK